MASIKLKHASGNSTILNSPASNPSADVTLKLPSTTGSAGQVLKVASANHSATNAELEFAAAAGITMADTWYVSSSFTGSATPISSNWSQYTSHNTGTIGTGMSQSSGVFTFPSTGIYEMLWFAQFFRNGGQVNYAKVYQQVTTNNNTFTSVPAPYASVNSGDSSGFWYANMTSSHILDVTDVGNVKIRFSADLESSACAVEQLTVQFVRLGDT